MRTIPYRLFLIWTILFLGAGSAAWGQDEEASAEIKPVDMKAEVTTVSVHEGSLPLMLLALGKIDAPRQSPATIVSLAAGVVTKIAVSDGQQVNSGTLLLTMDPRAARAALQKARSDMALAEKELAYAEKSGMTAEQEDLDLAASQARVKALQAAKEYDRLNALFAKALVSEKAVTEARQAMQTSQQEASSTDKKAAVFHRSGQGLELDRLRAKIEEARVALRLAEIEEESTTVRSPLAGRVTRVNVTQGQAVEKGIQLIELAANQGIGVTFALPPSQAIQVKPEMTFQLADDKTTRTYEGKISAISAGVDSDSGLVRVQGIISSNNAPHPYLGEVLRGGITVGLSPAGIIVPISAVTRTDDGTFIYSVDEKHIAHQVPVQLVTRTSEAALVTGPIKAGQLVVSDGNYNLPDGAGIKEKGIAEAKDKDEKAEAKADEKAEVKGKAGEEKKAAAPEEKSKGPDSEVAKAAEKPADAEKAPAKAPEKAAVKAKTSAADAKGKVKE